MAPTSDYSGTTTPAPLQVLLWGLGGCTIPHGSRELPWRRVLQFAAGSLWQTATATATANAGLPQQLGASGCGSASGEDLQVYSNFGESLFNPPEGQRTLRSTGYGTTLRITQTGLSTQPTGKGCLGRLALVETTADKKPCASCDF